MVANGPLASLWTPLNMHTCPTCVDSLQTLQVKHVLWNKCPMARHAPPATCTDSAHLEQLPERTNTHQEEREQNCKHIFSSFKEQFSVYHNISVKDPPYRSKERDQGPSWSLQSDCRQSNFTNSCKRTAVWVYGGHKSADLLTPPR